MEEILKNIKSMIENNKDDEVVKYIDKILSKNKNAENYIDDLISDLK